jgi:beta-lactamase class A
VIAGATGRQTGLDRLRWATPTGWTAGDKTGGGDNGLVNDVALAPTPRSANPQA